MVICLYPTPRTPPIGDITASDWAEDVAWNVEFDKNVSVTLKTSWGDAGHVAAGMWWGSAFKEHVRMPISNTSIRVDFDIAVEEFNYTEPNEWLRVALASAVQRNDGSVIYTELDILDSPNTQRHPLGNIQSGGNTIYRGGDVVEYKLDQIPLKTWKHYSLDLTGWIDKAWSIRNGDRLESVYVVVECENNPVNVAFTIDNLWIYKSAA